MTLPEVPPDASLVIERKLPRAIKLYDSRNDQVTLDQVTLDQVTLDQVERILL
jgi:hypothetical protein